jgi:tetratricopeptide (TPR) repeat protein
MSIDRRTRTLTRIWRISFLCFLAFPGIPLRSEPADPVALFRDGQFDRAREAFARRLSAEPDNPEALYYLGRLTLEGAKSREYFVRLLKTHPGHELADDALFELAEADYAGPSGRYFSAENRYGKLLNEYGGSPLAPLAHYRLGSVYLMTQRPDAALAEFQTVLDASRVGVFGNGENLRRISLRLAEAGFPVQEEATTVPDFRILMVGPFPDRAAASREKPRVEKEAGVVNCIIVERQ